MKKPIIQRTVRFEQDQIIRLDAIAAQERRSFADLLRNVIGDYLDSQQLQSDSRLRLARVTEYAQAALDTIILEQHPEHREKIVAETARRMERYHAAR